MKTAIFYLGFALFALEASAQIGINTTTPAAQLDIRSGNQAVPANTDGMLIPKVDAFPAVNPTAVQQGMMVYLTTTSGTRQPGFYYWDNPTVSWVGFSTSGNDKAWYEEATTIVPDAITDDMFHAGNVAIGKNTADFPLEIKTTAFAAGIKSDFSSNTNDAINKAAVQSVLAGNTSDNLFGVENTLSGTGNSGQAGMQNHFTAEAATFRVWPTNSLVQATATR
jgi:hypothetical protein